MVPQTNTNVPSIWQGRSTLPNFCSIRSCRAKTENWPQ